MKINLFIYLLSLIASVAQARAAEQPATTSFYENGSWNGEVTASRWRGINTSQAWAIGRHTQANAKEACSARQGSNRTKCIRELIKTPAIEVMANCAEGVAWRVGEKERYHLSAEAMAGKLQPIEDVAAWTDEMTHRGRWTVGSWFQLLCPSASKQWHIPE